MDGIVHPNLEIIKYRLGAEAQEEYNVPVEGSELLENPQKALKYIQFQYRAKKCILTDDLILKQLYMKGIPKVIFKVTHFQFFLQVVGTSVAWIPQWDHMEWAC